MDICDVVQRRNASGLEHVKVGKLEIPWPKDKDQKLPLPREFFIKRKNVCGFVGLILLNQVKLCHAIPGTLVLLFSL